MKLVLVISNLGCGGAERVMSLLSGVWARRGHEVVLVTLGDTTPFFPLDRAVRLIQLGVDRPTPHLVAALLQLVRVRRTLTSLLRDLAPDLAISFTTRVNIKVLMAAARLNIPVIISERNDPRAKPLNRLWTVLRNRWYPRAKQLVVQTPVVSEWFAARGLSNVCVIPNPVELVRGHATTNPRRPAVPPLILNVARLMPQKGQADLIRAMAQVQRKDVRLRILGDGPERNALRALADELGLFDRLELPGFVADKAPHFQEASLFVLSSYYEGFPNALVEAMAEGLPCVSYDCPSGPSDLIRDGESGLLVPVHDIAGLARAIERILNHFDEASLMGTRAQSAIAGLGLDTVADRWESLWNSGEAP